MATHTAPATGSRVTLDRLRTTTSHRHVLVARIVAGVPLFVIGLAHVFDPGAAMRPLVEAAGIPFAAVTSPVGVAFQVVGGALLLLGWHARIGGALGIPTMIGAIWAHLVIDVWPNGAENEPPLVLPIAVLLAAAYVVWRGAGRWSLDHRATR
jgi:putative oxidoreductase